MNRLISWSLIGWDMLHDIRNRTTENITECVNCVGADAFVPFQARDLRRTDSKGVVYNKITDIG